MRLTNSSRRWKEKKERESGRMYQKKSGRGMNGKRDRDIKEVYLESLKISVHLTWKEGKYVRDLLNPPHEEEIEIFG